MNKTRVQYDLGQDTSVFAYTDGGAVSIYQGQSDATTITEAAVHLTADQAKILRTILTAREETDEANPGDRP